MVVLSGSICTRGGKPLLVRQLRELSQDRVTSLLSNFPTLLSESTQTQHTSVEDEFVRYVYQPLEEFYVVLITNKHSNILEDIETLHLFAQEITSILRTVDEREIFDNCFEILSAFDEVVNLGYRENLSLSQVLTFLEMESHEEKIQEIIDRNKELEAAEERKRKETEIFLSNAANAAADLRNKELMRKAMNTYDDSSMFMGQQAAGYNRAPAASPYEQPQSSQNSLGGSLRNAPPRHGGLQLGKKASTGLGDSQPLISERPAPQQQRSTSQRQASVEPRKPQIANNGILVVTNEKFSAQISREGSIASAEVKGDLQIRINDVSLALAKLKVSLSDLEGISTQYKTHPNIDKKLFNGSKEIGMKDPSKPFPSNDQTLGVLRWKVTPKASVDSEENVLLPLMLTTWVNNNNDGTITLTFEYENVTDQFIDEATVLIPAVNATIESADNDNATLEFSDEGLSVKLTGLLDNPEGSVTIICKEVDDEEALFPMELAFEVTKQLEDGQMGGLVTVDAITSAETGEELPYDKYYRASSEGYYIV